jgi:hypothetical protein
MAIKTQSAHLMTTTKRTIEKIYMMREGINPTVIRNVSIERLYHFNCPDCQGWWTIGDLPKIEKMFCPYCGQDFGISQTIYNG